MALFYVTYSKTTRETITGSGPFTQERITTLQPGVYVEADSIIRVPVALTNFCTTHQILEIKKLTDHLYKA